MGYPNCKTFVCLSCPDYKECDFMECYNEENFPPANMLIGRKKLKGKKGIAGIARKKLKGRKDIALWALRELQK